MRGVLVKCNADRVRIATDEEWLGAESIKVLSQDARIHRDKHGQRGYIDATDEGGPEPDDPAPPAPEAASGRNNDPPVTELTRPNPRNRASGADEMSRQVSTTVPTASTRTASEAGTETANERNVRARIDENDVDLNADRARLGVPVPHGGWIQAAQRQAENNNNNSFATDDGCPRAPQACVYVGTAEIILDSYDTIGDCVRWMEDIYYQASCDAADLGRMSRGYTAAQAVICFNEETQRLEVMLNTTDACAVKSHDLAPAQKAAFDKARGKEV